MSFPSRTFEDRTVLNLVLIIFAMESSRFQKHDHDTCYTLRHNPASADIALQATDIARLVIKPCTICQVSRQQLQFLHHNIPKLESPELTSCDMNFTMHKKRTKQINGTSVAKARKRPPTLKPTSPVSSGKTASSQGISLCCTRPRQATAVKC